MPEVQAKKKVESHRDLEVWQRGRNLATQLFGLSKAFPKEETYSLTDQMRRSSRSVTANIAEAWQKRRYEAAFINKLTDSAAEAAETQDWLLYAADCGYVDESLAHRLIVDYEGVLKTLKAMMFYAPKWCLPATNHKLQTTDHIPSASNHTPHTTHNIP
jgi:four helix bundle protein